MKRRRRPILKWMCTALTVLLLVVWVGSAWWRCAVITAQAEVTVQSGCVVLSFCEPDPGFPTGINWRGPRRHGGSIILWIHPIEATNGLLTQWGLWVPIWLLAVFPGSVTALLWCGDLRPRQGCCRKCGYDLRGADHQVCPECGEAAPGELTVES